VSPLSWLFWKVPDEIVAVELIVIGCIVFTWALLAVLDGLYMHREHGASLDTFPTNLGGYLIWSTILKFILSIQLIRFASGADLWAFLFVNVGCFFALRAYRSWARGKMNGSWDGHA
jgi:hypothetical protein